MEPALSSVLTVAVLVTVVVVGGLAYLRRVRIERPPIGVANRRDIAIMMVVVVVLPPLYLWLPAFVVAALLTLVVLAILLQTIRPLAGRAVAWALAAGLVAADIAIVLTSGHGPAFLAVNNAIVGLAAIGAANVWVQGGLRARDVVLFAVLLAVYDAVATLALPTMVDFFARVAALPLTPVVGWGEGNRGIAVGLGDLLLVLLWSLTITKGYGWSAGFVASALGVGGLLVLLFVLWADLLNVPLPAMVLLGPVFAGHYVVLRRRRLERGTGAFFASLDGGVAPAAAPRAAVADLVVATALLSGGGDGPARVLAVCGGRVVGSGERAVEALRAAREAGVAGVPVLVTVSAKDVGLSTPG